MAIIRYISPYKPPLDGAYFKGVMYQLFNLNRLEVNFKPRFFLVLGQKGDFTLNMHIMSIW